MKTPRLTLETTFYTLAVVLALALRFIGLGALPLSDAEAAPAVQALDLARGAAPASIQHPAYVMLTGALFALLPADNTLARLFPALAGCLLVLLPWLLRRWLGRIPGYSPSVGVLLAFALALDPGLTAASRTVGSAMAAAAFGLLALAAYLDHRPVWAGVCAALALLSGPGLWPGALGLGLAAVLILLVEKAGWLAPLFPREDAAESSSEAFDWRKAVIAAGVTLLACGTLFFRYPAGLGGIAAALGSFFQGWASMSGVPLERALGVLLVSQPLALLLGLGGWVYSWARNDGLGQRLGLWALAATLAAVISPARQMTDLAWAIVPWWALAAWAFVCILEAMRSEWVEDSEPRVALGHALLVFILLLVARMYFMFFITGRVQGNDLLQIIAVDFLIIAVATGMVGVGWAFRSAITGLFVGVIAAVGVSLAAASIGAGQARPNAVAALWYPIPAAGQVDLLVSTLEDLSEWHTGERHELDVMAVVDAPSLRWALRNFRHARFGSGEGDSLTPAALITLQEASAPGLQASYRGQDFDWWASPNWAGFLPPEGLRWLAYGDAPLNWRQVILWGRADLFPGGELASPDPVLLPLPAEIIPEEAPAPENSNPGQFP